MTVRIVRSLNEGISSRCFPRLLFIQAGRCPHRLGVGSVTGGAGSPPPTGMTMWTSSFQSQRVIIIMAGTMSGHYILRCCDYSMKPRRRSRALASGSCPRNFLNSIMASSVSPLSRIFFLKLAAVFLSKMPFCLNSSHASASST